MPGLVHVYTGNGKGKTTAAVGLGIRALGRGFRVLLVQFLKGAPTGELAVLAQLGPGFEVRRNPGVAKFVSQMSAAEQEMAQAATLALWQEVLQVISSGERDLVILDEVMAALKAGFLPLEEVITLVQGKPAGLELVLTGRAVPPELVALADYVSEIQPRKHPYEKGIPARKGIEY